MRALPERIIGEILGTPAAQQRSPVNAGYLCPFINGECTKRGHHLEGPYPVCSVWHLKKSPRLITICPNRFFQAAIKEDVIQHCWPGQAPANPRVAYEVSMEKFGTVDMVIADLDQSAGVIRQFVSVELQAVDLSGTVEPAYSGVLNNLEMVETNYGVNWANVRKRFVEQLVSKGFYHHQWGTRVVAVMQTPLYDKLREHIQFDELSVGKRGVVDVMFLLYDYLESSGDNGDHKLMFDRAVGTSHSSLMMHTLYQNPPPKHAFAARILERL